MRALILPFWEELTELYLEHLWPMNISSSMSGSKDNVASGKQTWLENPIQFNDFPQQKKLQVVRGFPIASQPILGYLPLPTIISSDVATWGRYNLYNLSRNQP